MTGIDQRLQKRKGMPELPAAIPKPLRARCRNGHQAEIVPSQVGKPCWHNGCHAPMVPLPLAEQGSES